MTARIETCMILAAGRGQRMQPLSSVLPKPALPLPGGPVVAWAMRLARSYTRRTVVNSWHLAERLEAVVTSLGDGPSELVLSREDTLMDTAGGIALARERGLLGKSGPVLVLNGDCVLRVDLEDLIERHMGSDDQVTLALLPHLDPTRWSRVSVDRAGRVVTIRPPGQPDEAEVPFLYTGAMILSRTAIDSLPVCECGIWDQLWRPAMAGGRLGGVVITGHWREVGTPGSYLDAALKLLSGKALIDDRAQIASDATVGVALIGENTRIDAGAVVAESVVSHGAVVGRGARVIRSVLLGPVEVGPGETVVNDIRTAQL